MKYVFIVQQLDSSDILGIFSNIDKAEDFVYEFQHKCVIYRVKMDDVFSPDYQYIKYIHCNNDNRSEG